MPLKGHKLFEFEVRIYGKIRFTDSKQEWTEEAVEGMLKKQLAQALHMEIDEVTAARIWEPK